MEPSDRIALVTGGSRGIGYAIAQALLADGARVMITGRDPSTVAAAVKSLGATAADAPARVAGEAVDVRDRDGVERVVSATADRFGGLNVLVNNAGVGAFVEVASMEPDVWSRVIDTNLTGVYYCSRAAIPLMKRAGGGWIISIASLAGRNYFPGGAAYCASKAGVIAFSEALMQEVRADGIRVSVVMPGSVKTEFSHPVAHADDSWKLTPDDVAQVVMDLLRHPARSLPSRVEMRPAKTR
jgi:NAD(P)-dependent dehydrogenase (short-subunit alcohol dehydrogenase family)